MKGKDKKKKTIGIKISGIVRLVDFLDYDNNIVEKFDGYSLDYEMTFKLDNGKKYSNDDLNDLFDKSDCTISEISKKVGAVKVNVNAKKASSEIEIEIPEDEEFDPTKVEIKWRFLDYPDETDENIAYGLVVDGKFYDIVPNRDQEVEEDIEQEDEETSQSDLNLKEPEDVAEEESSDSVEIPEEYKGLPLIEITTEKIDINDYSGDFPSYPTFGIVFHGYESYGRQAIVIAAEDHEHLCKEAARVIDKYIEPDEDIPVSVVETKTINGFGEASDIEEIPSVIGAALIGYYDPESDRVYEDYEWDSWFPDEAIFCVDDDVFIASKDGYINLIDAEDLSVEQLNAIKIADYDFHDGLAAQEGFDGYYGFINKSGAVVIPPDYFDASHFSEGLCAVAIDFGKWGFIDTNGNMVIEPQFYEAGDFHNGQCEVQTKEFRLTIDKKGNILKKEELK